MTDQEFDLLIGEITAGTPTRQALKEHKVTPGTFYRALAANEARAEQYTRAKSAACHAMADEIIEIGDTVPESKDAVAKARLRTDDRKWLLSKLLPKVYGEKPLDLNVSGALHVTMTPVDRNLL